MPNRIALFSLLVPEYDEAIAFFTDIGFDLKEDTDLGDEKRWVRMSPPNADTDILLARASSKRQVDAIGEQGGGRVWLFLETLDFTTDHARIEAAGGRFEGPARIEPYGRVAVWSDPWGNRWDLIQFAHPDRSGTTA